MRPADTAPAMAIRASLRDLREQQAACWQRQATLTRIEAALPTMTVEERAAMANELAVFARAALNGCQSVLRITLDLAARTQEQLTVTDAVERYLRPWLPPAA